MQAIGHASNALGQAFSLVLDSRCSLATNFMSVLTYTFLIPSQKAINSLIIMFLYFNFVFIWLQVCVQARNTLEQGEILYAGQILIEGAYSLHLKPNCELLIIHEKEHNQLIVKWVARSNIFFNNCLITMQEDGSLVMYGYEFTPWGTNAMYLAWFTNTVNRAHSENDYYYFRLLEDGSARIFHKLKSGGVTRLEYIWST